MDKVKTAIGAHSELVARAIRILEGEPFNERIDDEDTMRLSLDPEYPDEAWVNWMRFGGDCTYSTCERIPLKTLTMSTEELGAWRGEQVLLKQKEREKKHAEYQEQQKRRNYEWYLRLKAEFEPNG